MDDMVVYGMLWLVAREEEAEEERVPKDVATGTPVVTAGHPGEPSITDTVNMAAELGIPIAWTPSQYNAYQLEGQRQEASQSQDARPDDWPPVSVPTVGTPDPHRDDFRE